MTLSCALPQRGPFYRQNRRSTAVSHTAVSCKYHNNRTAEASQCPHACMVLGLNVCVWGQMDTFMSVWVWIILPATSGAPHGTADCGKRGRWARGEGTSPVGSLTSTPTDRRLCKWQTERLLDDHARQMLLWILESILSSSVLNFLSDSNSLPLPCVRCDYSVLYISFSVLLKDTL